MKFARRSLSWVEICLILFSTLGLGAGCDRRTSEAVGVKEMARKQAEDRYQPAKTSAEEMPSALLVNLQSVATICGFTSSGDVASPHIQFFVQPVASKSIYEALGPVLHVLAMSPKDWEVANIIYGNYDKEYLNKTPRYDALAPCWGSFTPESLKYVIDWSTPSDSEHRLIMTKSGQSLASQANPITNKRRIIEVIYDSFLGPKGKSGRSLGDD